jgi:peptidoglycan/xylan/chitin deacetylase (PgdA/CDA1 family)
MTRHLLPLALVPLVAWLSGPAGELRAEEPKAPSPDAERLIAITVDDLPVNGADDGLPALQSMNERLLDALVRHDVPAVGFVNEARLYRPGETDGRIALMKAWLDRGFELGNHSYSHPSLNRIGRAAFEEEVVRGETITRLLLEARKIRYFRHPFLEAGATAEDKAGFEDFLARRGYRIAPVTVDAWDWYFSYRYAIAKRRGDPALMERVVAAYLDHLVTAIDYSEAFSHRLFGRNIRHVLLMHENVLAADHFDRVAALFTQRGYRFVALEEALADPAYAREDRYVGGGVNWLVRWATTAGMTELPPAPRPPDWLETLEAERSSHDPQ